MPSAFIRIQNSFDSHWDVALGPKGTVLMSGGVDSNGNPNAPTFAWPAGFPSHGFSYTQGWELPMLVSYGGFDFGVGNFTCDFERTLLEAGVGRVGPANYTTGGDAPWTKRI